MCFGCSKGSYRDGSFEYPQHMFWMRTKENSFPIRSLICSPEMKDAAFTIGVAVMFLISDFIWPFLRPYMGVIPNPKMAFIFPISCILALIFPILIKYFPKYVGKGSFPKSPKKSLLIMDMANKIIRNSDDKFHKLFISKVPAQ